MKLQKLVLCGQAYSLVTLDEPFFSDDFKAWINGPACLSLFRAHKGLFVVGEGDLRAGGDWARLRRNRRRA